MISAKALASSMGSVWFDHRKQHGLREEAPAAYKDIRRVMRDQQELVRIISQHRPRADVIITRDYDVEFVTI